MPPVATDVPLGLVLDARYRIDEVIGHGGMATVYRAWDTTLGRDVAVKLFPPAPDDDEVLRFDAEIGFLAQLVHPNLVALYDAGSAPAGSHAPQAFIVMELVAGPTLAERLGNGPLPAEEVARIGHQLADALACVHEAQVVHRDVKPANVLLVDLDPVGSPGRPAVKLADFGIARLIDADRVTRTGTTMGTATYLSPEQAAGEAVGPPTDVYALGLVLLECLTGQKAFTGTVAEVAAARLTTAPPIPDEIGTAWGTLLRDMTRRDPAERVTMADAAAHFRELDGAPSETAMISRAAAPFPAARTADRTALLDVSHHRSEVADLDVLRVSVSGPFARGLRGGRRLVALIAAATVVLVLGLTALLLRPQPGEEADEPLSVPVEGPLGGALEDLVRSVRP